MHPQPLSEEKPAWSPRLFRRMVKDMAERDFGSVDRAMGSKPDRYVIQMRASKSSTKDVGQPPSSPSSSYASDELKLLETDSGGVSGVRDGVDCTGA